MKYLVVTGIVVNAKDEDEAEDIVSSLAGNSEIVYLNIDYIEPFENIMEELG